MAEKATGYNGHLLQWDIAASRKYEPHYYLTGERAATYVQPIRISVNVEVDDVETAHIFEQSIRKIIALL